MDGRQIELVPAGPALAEQTADYYRRNRDFLRPYEPQREESFFSPEGQRAVLAQEVQARRDRTGFRFYIRPAGQGQVIGSIGLNNVVWGAFRSAFLGYKLDRDWLGRGCMPAAVELVVGYAFDQLRLHRIEANVMPRNRASLRVLEKCGFVNEGLSRYYLNINGVWEDHIHMVRLNAAMHGAPLPSP